MMITVTRENQETRMERTQQITVKFFVNGEQFKRVDTIRNYKTNEEIVKHCMGYFSSDMVGKVERAEIEEWYTIG